MTKPKAKTSARRFCKKAGGDSRLERLAGAVAEVRAGERSSPRTSKLLISGVPKMAQKVIEEAAEVAIEAVRGEKVALVNESVDLLYNLVILWSEAGVSPEDVWGEMDRREVALGMAEKLPKVPSDDVILPRKSGRG